MKKVFGLLERVVKSLDVDLGAAGVSQNKQNLGIRPDRNLEIKPKDPKIIVQTSHHEIIGEPGGRLIVRGRKS